MLEAECREDNGFSYLAITVNGDSNDARIDDIGGDLSPDWGLHLVDANVAMGDLVMVAASQSEAYQAVHQTASGDDDGCAIGARREPSALAGLMIGVVLLVARRLVRR
jgi:hypothetical protein